jgi:two-component system, LytTR family, sensor kinase
MKISINQALFIRHLISWIVVAFIFQMINQLNYPIPLLMTRAALEILILMIPYYLYAIFIAPIYIVNKLKGIALIIVTLLLFLSLYYLLEYGLEAYQSKTHLALPIFKWIVNTFVYFIMIILLAHGFYNNQITLHHMALANKKEQDSLKYDIRFLKNKYNEQIGFGFLDYCETIFTEQYATGKNAIITYKNLLSNTLNIGTAQTISIDNEIQYIEQFIQLYQIIHENTYIQLIKSMDANYQILPRILITYIENALKYGISNDVQKPIMIHLHILNNELELTVSNHKKVKQTKVPSTQSGQINAQQQLELYYPKKYAILVDENDHHYQLKLKLSLKKYD